MTHRLPAVDAQQVARWCERRLGSPPTQEIFRADHVSTVMGLHLADGRQVVVKVRADSPRVAACVSVQRHLFDSGYPCHEPLTEAAPLGDGVATAEAYVPGGSLLPSPEHSAWAFADAFARLIAQAPRPVDIPSLDPPPAWVNWNHAGTGLWPQPDDSDVDLNTVVGPGWIDDVGRRARDRLRASSAESVIGHCDWLASNLRWAGDELLVVHDWDSAAVDCEAVLVGFAAALYSTISPERLATVGQTQQFLEAYGAARGRELDADEIELSWAAGVWTRAFDAKCQHAYGQPVQSLTEVPARARLGRAGAG